jgi:hypothetical protein
MSNTPDPAALASVVNRDALDGKVSVVSDNPDETRGQELDDTQEPVGGARENGIVGRGV